ncbi:MAG: hypothetical protein WBE89_10950 [Methyloceanibacter sp.]|jgi:hypothetical protein
MRVLETVACLTFTLAELASDGVIVRGKRRGSYRASTRASGMRWHASSHGA